MELNGLLHGARLLSHVDFPTSEVLGPDAGEDQIQDLIARHGLIFIKPVFRGGVGKKGKAGLIGKARTLKEALAEKERLYFCEHRHGNACARANGVTFEAGVPAEPYATQIATLGRQIGAVVARQMMKDKSGASVMDPTTQVTSVHGHDVLDLALQPGG